MNTKKHAITIIGLVFPLLFTSAFSSLPYMQHINQSTSEGSITVTFNGLPFSFTQDTIIRDGAVWLPGKELLMLMNLFRVNQTEGFLEAGYYDEEHNFLYCFFPNDTNTYSRDAHSGIFEEVDSSSFVQNEELFLPEEMIEAVFGDFIFFDAETNNIVITYEPKTVNRLQEENDNPFMIYHLKSPDLLQDSRINTLLSGMVRDSASEWINHAEAQMKLDGFTETRATLNFSDSIILDMSYADIEKEIPTEYVEYYRVLQEMGIKIRYSLNFWDMEYRLNGGEISLERMSSEEEVQRYLAYVEMVVSSLKGLVNSYELWNEPDANKETYQYIRPEDYISLAERTIPLIRSIDPDAEIVLVSTSSYNGEEAQSYTRQILESDVIQLADAISVHAVNSDTSPEYKSEYYYGYDAMWNEIKETAEAHGFTGIYYADELNYRSYYSLYVLQPEESDCHPYDEQVAAKYIGRMIAINFGLDNYIGTSGTNSGERLYEGLMIRNMAYIFDELDAMEFTVQVESDSDLVRYYTFKDASENKYIAIWNDDVAEVESTAIQITLKIPDTNGNAVLAIDPSNSLKQDLIFYNVGSNVIIKNFLLQDYPVIIAIDTIQ